MGQVSALAVSRCCQDEQPGMRWNPEDADLHWEHGSSSQEPVSVHELNGLVGHPGPQGRFMHGLGARPECSCCKADAENPEPARQPLESLSYMPVRWDDGSTIDIERSHQRYSKIAVHSTRARTQQRSKAWEDWLRAATAGRAITLLNGFAEDSVEQAPALEKIPAMYHLDRTLTKLSVLPTNGVEMSAITILVDNIQVICPATDFMLFFDQLEAKLDASEKTRAVLLQYLTEDTERKRLCFLEESESSQDCFVQALTALWLEKRNDHSMWF